MKRIFAALLTLAVVQLVGAAELETFTSRGNPKTLGVDFSLGRPKVWVTRNAMPPGAFAVFWQAPAGLVDHMAIVFPRTASGQNEEMTKEDFRGTFENPQLEQMFGRALGNARFLGKKLLDDYKFPAGYFDYSIKYKVPTGETEMKVRNYLVYLGSVMVQVQFFLVQDAGADRFEQFGDTMKQILDSLEYPAR
jgi:hypothetical protein